jgi:multiple sugar transport system substrate-binding protein
MFRWFLILALGVATLPFFGGHANADEARSKLHAAFLVSGGEQRQIYFNLVDQFEKQHPSIEVVHTEYEQEAYKARVERWLTSATGGPDVLFWFAGTVLSDFARKGLLYPIDQLWDDNEWDNTFPDTVRAEVSQGGQVIALPFSTYHWGIYFRKSLFQELDLAPPANWKQFLEVGETLKKEGITPIAVGAEALWPMAAWFDYLNLRINGLEFHQKLTAGEVSFLDPRVREVMERWHELVEKDFFQKNHGQRSWRTALPYLYRKTAGMMLMGGFVKPQFPKRVLADMGVIPFPEINPELPRYENAPTDVFIIPDNARNKRDAERFLAFLAEQSTQYWINQKLGTLPPALLTTGKVTPQDHMGQQILADAAGLAQFFDRDSNRAFSSAAMAIFVEFSSGQLTVNDALQKLEEARTTTPAYQKADTSTQRGSG